MSQDALIDIQIKRIHEYKRPDPRENRAMTWGSKPMKHTIFGGMNIQKSQLFWCENQGTRVLTHRHMLRNKFLFTFFWLDPQKTEGTEPANDMVGDLRVFQSFFIHIFPNLMISPEFPRRSETSRRQLMNILYVIHRYQVGRVRPGTISCGSVWRRGTGTQNSIFNWI